MAGGSFTISNVSRRIYTLDVIVLTLVQGGVFGSLMGTPIINLPQTGILTPHVIRAKHLTP
jgi:pyruvate/2-oxoglutarate dehydrogenase complex dihydrolipoamide acyltransferase (E2) component